MVTIRDIAEECGVSIATVSNVLNGKKNVSEKVRSRVLDAAEALNYTPNTVAKNLKTKKAQTVGVVVEDITIFSIPDLVDGITEYCEAKGYGVALNNMRLFKKFDDTYYHQIVYKEQLQEILKGLLADQVGAIIYVSAHERSLKCLPESFQIPLVMCYADSTMPGIPSVLVEEKEPTEELLDYALSMGHRRIGVITGKSDSMHSQERLVAYQNFLYRNGILYDPALVCQGDWERESGYRYTDYLLEQHVTLIFCMNDLMAGGVYDRLTERGLKVGEDISVLGYDNRLMSGYMYPPLTTVELPLHDMGYRSAEIALDAIEHGLEALPREIRVRGELILRDSVCKID